MANSLIDHCAVLQAVQWDEQGLVPAIAQDVASGEVLMVAWMNAEALNLSLDTGFMVYWSRSRRKLWKKGEESGHQQVLKELRLDCDGDVILAKVEQMGGIACHTGRRRCFYRLLSQNQWIIDEPQLKDPAEIYSRIHPKDKPKDQS